MRFAQRAGAEKFEDMCDLLDNPRRGGSGSMSDYPFGGEAWGRRFYVLLAPFSNLDNPADVSVVTKRCASGHIVARVTCAITVILKRYGPRS